MRKLLSLFLFTVPLLFGAAQESDSEDQLLLSDKTKKMFDKENKTASQAVSNEITKKEALQIQQKAKVAAATERSSSSSDVMIVDPNVVATDWVNAFTALNARKLSDLTFVLRDNTSLTNISDVEAMPGGYLILFTLKTVQGTKYRVVKTGDIVSLETR